MRCAQCGQEPLEGIFGSLFYAEEFCSKACRGEWEANQPSEWKAEKGDAYADWRLGAMRRMGMLDA